MAGTVVMYLIYLNPELASFPNRLKTYYISRIGNGDDVMKHSMSIANQFTIIKHTFQTLVLMPIVM